MAVNYKKYFSIVITRNVFFERRYSMCLLDRLMFIHQFFFDCQLKCWDFERWITRKKMLLIVIEVRDNGVEYLWEAASNIFTRTKVKVAFQTREMFFKLIKKLYAENCPTDPEIFRLFFQCRLERS